MTIHDAIIVGAGIAGASMACALAGQGWDTVLLDRHTFPRHKVCGEYLSPESRRSLIELGLDSVLSGLQPSPIPIARIRIAASAGIPLKLELPASAQAQSVSRYALDLALQAEAHARGAQVRTSSTVTAISQTPEGWQVTVRSRERESYTLQARAVIGAWGRMAPAGLSDRAPAKSFMGLRTELSGVPADAAVELYFSLAVTWGLSPAMLMQGWRMRLRL